jgi:fatty-acyl-CoA synthase
MIRYSRRPDTNRDHAPARRTCQIAAQRPASSYEAVQELLAHLDGGLARYKIPKSVVFTDKLPHNASGKLAKPELRRTYGVTAQGEDRT